MSKYNYFNSVQNSLLHMPLSTYIVSFSSLLFVNSLCTMVCVTLLLGNDSVLLLLGFDNIRMHEFLQVVALLQVLVVVVLTVFDEVLDIVPE